MTTERANLGIPPRGNSQRRPAKSEVVARQRTPHLIGREDALRRLGAGLEHVSPAGGSLALVSGEAGIGKTRLLEEFAARESETIVARGGCVEDVAYAPWTEALWWLLDRTGPEIVGELPGTAAALLGHLLPSLATAAPDDAGDGPHLLFESVVELLRLIATKTRLVLVIDDVHWVDPASRELLRYVAGNLRRIPILLVVAYRAEQQSGERELFAQLGRLAEEHIELDRLPDDTTTEIATILLGGDAPPTEIERITHDAGGNPLFVEELVAAASSTGIPPSLRDLMLARFSLLDDDARHLTRIAAVIGAHAPRAWLVRAADLAPDRARAAARAAAEAGVLVADEAGGYEFRHALLRQAVLDDLLPDDLVELHRAIAQALTDDAASAVGVDRVAELARHWDAAEAAEPALRWLVAAARHAEESYAFAASFEAYERALVWWDAVLEPAAIAGVDHAALLLEAADAAGLAGAIERAADLARAGLDESFALDTDRGVDAAGRAYPLLWNADRAEELFEFATANVLPVLDRVDPGVRARFLVTRAEHLAGYAPPSETREPAAEMMAAFDDLADPALEARAHVVNAWCQESFGELEEADREYQRAAALANETGDHLMLALVLLNHASLKMSIGDAVACLDRIDAVDELVERFGLTRLLVSARYQRVRALWFLGELTAADRAIAGLNALFLEGMDAWKRAVSLALVDIAAGRVDDALVTLALDLPASDTELTIELATLRADALAWKGDLSAARREIDAGMAAAEQHPEAYWQGWLTMAGVRIEADAAAASGDLDAVEKAQDRAAALMASFRASLAAPNPIAEAHGRAIDAEWARLRNENALEISTRAADTFDALSMRYYATYFRWRSAEAMLDAEQRIDATELLKQTRATALAHGFDGLAEAISALARAQQLRLGPRKTTVDGDEALSVRELEVLRLMVDGMSNPQIAESLYISRRTAVAHVSSILRKLDSSSRVEAVSEALRRGYV
jgi:DNA-binding CsgD family transcriptional regulator